MGNHTVLDRVVERFLTKLTADAELPACVVEELKRLFSHEATGVNRRLPSTGELRAALTHTPTIDSEGRDGNAD